MIAKKKICMYLKKFASVCILKNCISMYLKKNAPAVQYYITNSLLLTYIIGITGYYAKLCFLLKGF